MDSLLGLEHHIACTLNMVPLLVHSATAPCRRIPAGEVCAPPLSSQLLISSPPAPPASVTLHYPHRTAAPYQLSLLSSREKEAHRPSSSGSLMKLLTRFVSHGVSSSALRPPLNPLEQLTCLMAAFRAEWSSGALACVPASPLPALHRDFLALVIILGPGLTLMPTNPCL